MRHDLKNAHDEMFFRLRLSVALKSDLLLLLCITYNKHKRYVLAETITIGKQTKQTSFVIQKGNEINKFCSFDSYFSKEGD